MKITIDLNEFWADPENGTLSEEIKTAILNDASKQVLKAVEKKITDFVDLEVKRQIEQVMYAQMRTIVSHNLTECKLKKRYSSSEQVSVDEWVKEEVARLTIDRNQIEDSVKKNASSIASELKNRYDLLFASQLVSKMNEAGLLGLLKDDVAKYLLDKK